MDSNYKDFVVLAKKCLIQLSEEKMVFIKDKTEFSAIYKDEVTKYDVIIESIDEIVKDRHAFREIINIYLDP